MSRFCTKKESKWSLDPLGSMKVTSSIVIFMNPSPSTTLPDTWPSFLSSTVVLLFLVITLSHLCQGLQWLQCSHTCFLHQGEKINKKNSQDNEKQKPIMMSNSNWKLSHWGLHLSAGSIQARVEACMAFSWAEAIVFLFLVTVPCNSAEM